MPIDIVWTIIKEGADWVGPLKSLAINYGPYIVIAALLKRFFSGASNTWEREMHGRVVMITGGTSGIGQAVAEDLAHRGAQLIFLTRSLSDAFLIDYIADLRERSKNQLIYAEEVDLADLHSIRVFATKWLDNSPPRRLDTLVCCAAASQPPFKPRQFTADGIEQQWGVNYLGHYHLITMLSPAFRVQPPGRDVRIVVAGCSSYVLADFDIADPGFEKRPYPSSKPWRVYGSSKLALRMFAREFQRTLDAYQRPDKQPNNARIFIADTGLSRTPSTRIYLSLGTLWGLLLYLIMWPIWWIVLKSPQQGAQTVLHAIMSPEGAEGPGAKIYRECAVMTKPSPMKIANDEEVSKKLYDQTAARIQELEKAGAIRRKLEAKTKDNTSTGSAKQKKRPSKKT
ncbi:hypothetical protein BZA70DRAFT_298390 [Myxozyma melibiosi]|uniref:Oxidoreductase n=1 Tax=Myxozyma melibiosi TaxID=54550 RepID=A0ABR1FDE8_9ASCO